MTKREIVDELKRQVESQGYSFAEFSSLDALHKEKRKHDRDGFKLRSLNYPLSYFSLSPYNFTIVWSKGYWDEEKIMFLLVEGVDKKVPTAIERIESICHLYISNSRCDLAWVAMIKKLDGLDLRNVAFDTLPETFANQEVIEELKINHSIISHLPLGIRKMKNLKKLAIEHCATIDTAGNVCYLHLPSWLSELPNIQEIKFNFSHIYAIPDDLIYSKMPFITESEPGRKGIHLFATKLYKGDISLFSQPRDVIIALHSGDRKPIRECKVIFLGEGGSGKSSLIERMINDTFEKGKLPTEGIRMQTWPIEIGEESMRLRILDFGGQEIMHAMHRCFMTRSTVYVLVCEGRQDGDIDREAGKWLETIQSLAPDCPVILALNKADENKNISVNETNLKAINPGLRKPVETSAKWEQVRGTKSLFEAIKNAANDVQDSLEINAEILGLKQALETMEQDYITDEAYKELCRRHDVNDEEFQKKLLNLFGELGICYFYESDAINRRLEGFRVLNPAWLTNGIYRLILRTPQSGILSHSDIKSTLAAADPNDVVPDIVYTPDETEFILHVMRKFEISHHMEGDKELIPLKMTKTTPEKASDYDTFSSLHLSWKAGYLPNTIVHRLMIHKYKELDLNCMWRNGACFESLGKKQSALVNMTDSCIDVYVKGDDARVYMEEFRKEIINILADLNIESEEVVHFIWEGNKHEYSYIRILDMYQKGWDRVHLIGVRNYPAPADILRENYVPEEERTPPMISIESVKLMLGSGNLVEGDMNITHGDISPVVKDSASVTIDVSVIPENISYRDSISQENFDKLIAELRKIYERQDIPLEDKQELEEVLNQYEGQSSADAWDKLRGYLGDAANFTKLATIASDFLQTAKNIFLS